MPPPFQVTGKAIQSLEESVGVSKGFFEALYDEDDWSFIIKLHALFEATCTHLLVFHFKEPELTDTFGRLELSGKSVGKTTILGKLGLLPKEYRRFISSLSELRNDLVHDIRNSKFDLSEYVRNLPEAELKTFAISFSPFESLSRKAHELFKSKRKQPASDKGISISEMLDRAHNDPKLHIWVGAYSTLVHIIDAEGYSDYKQWEKARRVLEDDVELEDGTEEESH